ncbi:MULTISPECIES: exodeoxyribonuclease VII large subunit [Glaesserella]|uniref:Exodeoxyribonuclease 7 large subunit n=1 Tax=Glaesserella australis TaxID=2094024 RepID=A0A328C1L9_9PAST|nr:MULTISPECIES: exodeoxyribonuclease VII large subunit [Glaesserella]AUI65756.1 exodeoxyribonuclease VII large subunit [Glaesserella sp. 15-184]RAL18960.1 exodeoxyribonuclease VII large subunit [Glaesserella australis]
MQNNILTISQLNYSVKQMLEVEFGSVWLIGEISNFSQPVSGHWYLTLKDEQAQVRCAMFRMKNMRVNFRPQNGMQVLVRANVSLYEPRGDYQVIIETMQPAGDGLLQQEFEQLKMKLAGLGLFAQEHKKPIPAFVKRVGIITSSSGAALQDMLQILARRDPSLEIVIYPTLVQGKEATAEIVRMIELANVRQECDVLIVGRGGGSLEDLWCFNEEAVAWAIYHSQLPIISAVGHETDVTIADFVADLRAPTPSAAAELVSRDQQELRRQLQHQFDKISLAFDRLWGEKLARFDRLQLRLQAQHPAKQLQQQQFQLQQLERRIIRGVSYRLQQQQQRLAQLSQRLQLQHPQRQLQQQAQQLQRLEKQAKQQIEQLLLKKQQRWKTVVQRVERNPLPYHLAEQTQQWHKFEQRLHYAMEKKLSQHRQRFQTLCTQLDSLSPLAVLARGYSVTQNQQGKAVLSSKDISIGENIVTSLAQGSIVSQVVEIR